MSENSNNEKTFPADNRETEVNYQCSSHFGIKNDSKNGTELYGVVVFRRSGGYYKLIK